ncbi:class I SAM-dependent methyltransferase [Sorangium sp. KYC3313]|uniref:class I SAM-dependent methyltransferase n=1 Tax=Sorangium sp. KYC3313 TaxID=3449740 RepID=UPI003F8CEEB7
MSGARENAALAWSAYFTAAVWASLGVPGAARFDTLRGRVLHQAARWGGSMLGLRGDHSVTSLLLAARHLGLGALLDEIAPEQVIELAAGLSPRGAEWARARPVVYIEVDQAAVIDAKRRLLEPAQPRGELVLVAADLREADLGEALGAALRDRRTAVVSEGLTGYLDEPALRGLLRQVRRVASRLSSCVVLMDFYLRDGAAATPARDAGVPGEAWLRKRALRSMLRRGLDDLEHLRALVSSEDFELRAAHTARDLAVRAGIAPPPLDLFVIAELAPARSSGDAVR